MVFKCFLVGFVLPTLIFGIVDKHLPNNDLYMLDLDYFLNEKLMPMSLMTIDNSSSAEQQKMARDSDDDSLLEPDTKDGSLGTAMNTMDFHRKMMNDYLCNNYVAEQILMDMAPPNAIQRRMLSVGAPRLLLRNDEGSQGYKDWLSK